MSKVSFAESVPMIGWHTHPIGTMYPETIRSLAAGRDPVLAAMDPKSIGEFFRFTEFEPFIDDFTRLCNLVSTPEALYDVALGLGRYALAHNMRLLVATHTPTAHLGISLPDQVAVLKDAADEVYDRTRGEVTLRYMFDIMCGDATELGDDTVRAAIRGKEEGVVVGLSIAGDETSRPLSFWRRQVRGAQDAGLGFVPHAGEARGADNVREAIELGAVRIAHGVRAVEDPRVVEELARRRTPLDMCLTSNLLLGVYRSLDGHPALQLARAGVPLTFDTDNPAMFATTPAREVSLALLMGFTELDIVRTLRTALDPRLLGPRDLAHVERLVSRDLRRIGYKLPPAA